MADDGQAAAYPFVPLPTVILFDERLSDAAKVLWAILYQYSRARNGEAFEMTLKEMMELTSAAKNSVVNRKKELVDAGWLEEVALRGLGKTNLYTVRTPGDKVPARQDQ